VSFIHPAPADIKVQAIELPIFYRKKYEKEKLPAEASNFSLTVIPTPQLYSNRVAV